MPHVVTLSETDWAEARMIVVDKDAAEALRFLKEKVVKPVEQSLNKALDVSRGRP